MATILCDTNFEYCLRQKLTLMANAAARVSSVKSQLRIFATRTRRDVRNAMIHQLYRIKAREEELFLNLEDIFTDKELKLCEQQEKLNQAIGACQQSLECLLRDGASADSVNMKKMLFKLNTIELTPKATPEICFEYDPSDLRRSVSLFGNIHSVDCQCKAATESLPLDVESYEDVGLLSHKSVLQLASNISVTAPSAVPFHKNLLPIPNSINSWLSQAESSPTKYDDDNYGFEFVRGRFESISGSSIEVINNKMSLTPPTEIFNNFFSVLDDLPKNHWLLNEAPEGTKSILPDLPKLVQEIKLESNAMSFNLNDLTSNKSINRKRTGNIPQVQTTIKVQKNESNFNKSQSFAFEDVIRSIQSSDDNQWLLKRKSSLPTVLDEFKTIEEFSSNEKPISKVNLSQAKSS